MSVPIYETTHRHTPEGNNLHSYCHKSLISCLSLYSDIQHLELVAQRKLLSINTPLILNNISQLMQCKFQVFLHMTYATEVTKPHQNQHDPRAYTTSVINQVVSVKHNLYTNAELLTQQNKC